MYHDFDDELFLGPETTVSLQFDSDEDWDIGHADAVESAERGAWARHALRSQGFGTPDYADAPEEVDGDLPMAIRRLVALSWE
jgi:hypothetical protein